MRPTASQIRLISSVATIAVLAGCASKPQISAQQESSTYLSRAGRSYTPPGPASDPWGPYITEASNKYDVPQRWIREVMRQESGGRLYGRNGSLVTSGAGAMGLMQVMPGTYDELRVRYPELGDDPYDPHNNILAGTAYIREMYDIYGAPGFLAAYNAGPGRLDDYLTRNRILPEETRRYVASIGPKLGGDSPNRPSPGAQYAMNALPLAIPDGPRYASAAPARSFVPAYSAAVASALNSAPPGALEQPVEVADASYAPGQPIRLRPQLGAPIRLSPPAAEPVRLIPQPVEPAAAGPIEVADASYTPGQPIKLRPQAAEPIRLIPQPAEPAPIEPVQAATEPQRPAASVFASTPVPYAPPAAPARQAPVQFAQLPEPPLRPEPVQAALEPRRPALPAFAYNAVPYAPPAARQAPVQVAALPQPPIPAAHSRPVQAAQVQQASRTPLPPEPPRQFASAMPFSAAPRPLGFSIVSRANAEPARHAAPAAGGAGHWAVQVGAFANEGLASAATASARGQAREVLAYARTVVAGVRQPGGVLYRARLTGLSHDAAAQACERLARSRTNCMVVSPDAQSY